MPWRNGDYPPSMKNLDPRVRQKAVQIANALLEEEGYGEGRAIAIATDKAKEWAIIRNGLQVLSREGSQTNGGGSGYDGHHPRGRRQD